MAVLSIYIYKESEMNIYYTYIYLNPLKPGKFTYENVATFFYEPYYVGKGKEYRIFMHLRNNKKARDNKERNLIIDEIRENNIEPKEFILKIINNISDLESIEYEKLFIKSIGRMDINEGSLTNHTFGGDGTSGRKCSEETKQKIRQKVKDYFNSDEGIERRKEISESMKGKSYNLGFKHSNESREKIRKANIGKKRILSEETLNKLRENGKILGKETCAKLFAGKPAWNRGIPHTEEDKIKMRLGQQRRWRNYREQISQNK